MVKAKELRLPFLWNERHILIKDRVWFVPPRPVSSSFVFHGWHSLFTNDNPVRIEYCSGNGEWILLRAKNDPTSNWIACEKRFDRVKQIWAKSVNLGCTNLLIVWTEALFFTSQLLPAESLAEVFVNFPDPWPKRRHAPNRLIRPDFVKELARCMRRDAHISLVTDDAEYAAQMVNDVSANRAFSSLLPEPFYRSPEPEYGPSFFDSLFRSQEKSIRQLLFRKTI